MKQGTDLNTLATRILADKNRKKDYAMNTKQLVVQPNGRLAFSVKGELVQVKPNDRCLNQMAARVGIPRNYAQVMMEQAPALLAQNLNHWFAANPETRMLRTYKGSATEPGVGRAFLSHKYRALDNEDLLNAVLPTLVDAGCEIKSAEATEKRLYIQAVSAKVKGEVKMGDVIQAGVVISNSEVGAGSMKVEGLHWRQVCSNGMILASAFKRHHVGRSGEGDWEAGEANEVFSDATRQLDDKAFWAKVNDVVKATVDAVKFKESLAKMTAAAKVQVEEPTDAVEVLVERYQLSDDEQNGILKHLVKGGDLSLWGLANAVTRQAEDCESYDRAVELERVGGEVVELKPSVFNN